MSDEDDRLAMMPWGWFAACAAILLLMCVL
jgi:hypothetical protein